MVRNTNNPTIAQAFKDTLNLVPDTLSLAASTVSIGISFTSDIIRAGHIIISALPVVIKGLFEFFTALTVESLIALGIDLSKSPKDWAKQLIKAFISEDEKPEKPAYAPF